MNHLKYFNHSSDLYKETKNIIGLLLDEGALLDYMKCVPDSPSRGHNHIMLGINIHASIRGIDRSRLDNKFNNERDAIFQIFRESVVPRLSLLYDSINYTIDHGAGSMSWEWKHNMTDEEVSKYEKYMDTLHNVYWIRISAKN